MNVLRRKCTAQSSIAITLPKADRRQRNKDADEGLELIQQLSQEIRTMSIPEAKGCDRITRKEKEISIDRGLDGFLPIVGDQSPWFDAVLAAQAILAEAKQSRTCGNPDADFEIRCNLPKEHRRPKALTCVA